MIYSSYVEQVKKLQSSQEKEDNIRRLGNLITFRKMPSNTN